MVQARVLTVSDRASRGEMTDGSGVAVVELLREAGIEVAGLDVLPDNHQLIIAWLRHNLADHQLLLTTGGTGLSPRDLTPQATQEVIEYEVPGFGEIMRAAGLAHTPMAALSRSLAGVCGRTLIINLPGSPRGAMESLQAVIPLLHHATQLLAGGGDEH
ncbi:MAG: MogA/MoaB family molybdenum cofactor biosynthesis protein [Candidatus Dormibacteraceae bacterium]